MPRHRRLLVLTGVLALALAVAPAASADGEHPGLTPENVDLILFPGGPRAVVEKVVHTPEIPPSVDVCLLEDETGSFGDDIANLQNPVTIQAIYDGVVAGAPGANFAVTGFRDYNVSPHGGSGDWVYRLLSSMSPNFTNWSNGVNALLAGGGADTPEAQYDAIVAAVGPGPTDWEPDSLGAQSDCGWRVDDTVTRVLVVTTDAPFHTPGAGRPHTNTAATTKAALDAAGVVVIGLKAPGAGMELNDLAAHTGGSVQPLSSNGANIAGAILAGLADIDVDVEMRTDCEWPIGTAFSPSGPQTVTSGDHAVFLEGIWAYPDAPGGTYTCRDWAMIDGAPMVDESEEIIYETKTIRVPEGFLTGGGQTGKGKKALNFGGNVGFLNEGPDYPVVGQWHFRDGEKKLNFHSLEIQTLQFGNDAGPDPDPPPANAEVADFTGTARVKLGTAPWDYSCTFRAQAHDHGEPNVADVFGIAIHCDTGDWVYGRLVLDTGNLQIHSGLKG